MFAPGQQFLKIWTRKAEIPVLLFTTCAICSLKFLWTMTINKHWIGIRVLARFLPGSFEQKTFLESDVFLISGNVNDSHPNEWVAIWSPERALSFTKKCRKNKKKSSAGLVLRTAATCQNLRFPVYLQVPRFLWVIVIPMQWDSSFKGNYSAVGGSGELPPLSWPSFRKIIGTQIWWFFWTRQDMAQVPLRSGSSQSGKTRFFFNMSFFNERQAILKLQAWNLDVQYFAQTGQ